MVEPQLNFFLIGAPKSGTSLIHDRMSRHPQVYLSPLKEPNHFASDIDAAQFSPAFRANHPDDLETYFARRPLTRRQVGFVTDPGQYAALFADSLPEHKVIGECSTSYLWSAEAADAIGEKYPEARILAVLRNPVDRLFSHWLMARKYGFTRAPLLEAVQKDLAHESPGWGRSELFVEAGRYAVQLERWLRVYPAGQVKVLLHEDLGSEATWKGLAEWLGLDGEIPESGTERVNPAGLPRWEGVNRWLTSSGLKGRMAEWMPASMKASLRSKWYSSEDMPRLQPDERRILFRHFEQDVALLEQLLGRDLAHWRP